ncbi:MAG: cytochrome P450 [Thermosynechococcaceae cyanobacterium]
MTTPQVPNASDAPRWLQTLRYTLNPLGYMDRAFERCGDFFNAPVIGNHSQVIFASHPDTIQAIFSSDALTAPSNQLLRPIVGDYSVFGLAGQRHRRERKLLMPPFHREQITTYGDLICDLTTKALEPLSIGDTVTARVLVQDISIEVILRVVFGLNEGPRFDQLKALLVEFSERIQNPLFISALFIPILQKDWGKLTPWGYLKSLQRRISQLLYAEIQDRRSQAPGQDILSLLMAAKDEDGQPMSAEELHDELLTLLLAGHEATTNAIAWALYWVHRTPLVLEELQSELEGVNADQPMALAESPYLNAVCNETLRISTVAFLSFPREVAEPINLQGYSLEPGTRIYACIYLAHRRPEIYPDPEQFRPERFLERKYSMSEFLPFGGGSRRCIGDVLAQYEMKLILATLLARHHFALTREAPETPTRRGVNVAPASGVQMTVQEIKA